MLDENRGHIPRHAKACRNFAAKRDQMQADRNAAYGEYIADVRGGVLPNDAQSVGMGMAVPNHIWTE